MNLKQLVFVQFLNHVHKLYTSDAQNLMFSMKNSSYKTISISFYYQKETNAIFA